MSGESYRTKEVIAGRLRRYPMYGHKPLPEQSLLPLGDFFQARHGLVIPGTSTPSESR